MLQEKINKLRRRAFLILGHRLRLCEVTIAVHIEHTSMMLVLIQTIFEKYELYLFCDFISFM
jgi:hypothetical protein